MDHKIAFAEDQCIKNNLLASRRQGSKAVDRGAELKRGIAQRSSV